MLNSKDDESRHKEQLVHEVADLLRQLETCVRQTENPKYLFEKRLIESETRYRVIFDQSPTAMLVIDPESGAIVGANEAAISCYSQDRSEFPIELSISGLLFKGQWHSAGVIRDITKRRNLEMQLRQAQKMEALGTLAGGVAHDYNNMLSVILTYSEMALEKLDPINLIHDNILEIHSAAVRSAEITRQLLAFARKQTIAPIVLDLNVLIGDMLKMLRRLIGEDIDLAWLPKTGLWSVRMDPGQVNQVLVNLCIKEALHG